MIKLDIAAISCFTKQQTDTCICPLGIGFNFSGMEYSKAYSLDRSKILWSSGKEAANISILPEKTFTEFSYGKDRENWIISFSDPDSTGKMANMRFVNNYLEVEIDLQPGRITIPREITISRPEVDYWRKRLREMRQAHLTRSTEAMFTVYSYCMDIFRLFISKKTDIGDFSPADKLRELIDQDSHFERSVVDLSKSCGFSAEHLRHLFVQRYGTTPKKYRTNLRMSRIMELIMFTDLSLKEIAAETGYNHLANFCQSFKSYYGMTAGEMIIQKRETDIYT